MAAIYRVAFVLASCTAAVVLAGLAVGEFRAANSEVLAAASPALSGLTLLGVGVVVALRIAIRGRATRGDRRVP